MLPYWCRMIINVITMKTLTFALVLLATPSLAQEYRTHTPYASQSLIMQQNRFDLNTVSSAGNLCQLEGTIQHNRWHDGNGCEVHFQTSNNTITLSVPERAQSACRQYCGHNAYFTGVYFALPTACQAQAEKQMEQRFQAAYQQKNYSQAAQIKQDYLNQCQAFLHITDNMHTRNDLAISYKNAGDLAACRRVLQPLTSHINPKPNETFQPSYLYQEAYEREVKHAQFNQRACRS